MSAQAPGTGVRRGWLALAAAAIFATAAQAQVTADRGASIVIFPKVLADASADTIIQLTNLSDNPVAANCAYVASADGTWTATGFDVALDANRTTHWTVASGRGAVPAAPAGFRGELLCVQVDPTGAPFSGNELAGQATVHDLASGDVTAYGAAGLRGSGFNDGDDVLCIGGEPSDNCFIGAEYDSCPAEWILTVPAEGASDAQLGPGSLLSSRLTVVPCSQNLRDGQPSTVAIDIAVFNELGQRFTAAAAVDCWADFRLTDVSTPAFTRGTLGTDFAEARLTPANGSGGFIVVAETTRSSASGALSSAAAFMPQQRGAVAASDLIILPMNGAVP